MRSDESELSGIPLLSDDELRASQDEIVKLASVLDDLGYRAISKIPTQPNWLALPREPLTLLRALRGDELIYLSAAFPALYRRLLSRETALLFPVFFEGRPVTPDSVEQALGKALVERLEGHRILVRVGDRMISLLRYTPSHRSLLISDRLNHRGAGLEPVWLGADSYDLAQHIQRDAGDLRVERGLDLCCGSGIQSFTIRRYASRVIGVDLNRRALTMAGINTILQGIDGVEFRLNDLAEGIDGPFGILCSNAPFVAMPEESRTGNLDAHGGPLGLDLTDRICADLPRLLDHEGRAYMLTTSPVVRGEDMLVSRMRALADAQAFDVQLTAYQYGMPAEHAEHHVEQGIDRVVCYVARVVNTGVAGFSIVPMPTSRALVTAAKVRFTRWRARWRSRSHRA